MGDEFDKRAMVVIIEVFSGLCGKMMIDLRVKRRHVDVVCVTCTEMVARVLLREEDEPKNGKKSKKIKKIKINIYIYKCIYYYYY